MVASTRTHLDHRSTPTSGRWWRLSPLLVFWLRLLPDAGKLRRSIVPSRCRTAASHRDDTTRSSVVRDKLDNARELERVLFKKRSDEEATRRNLSIVVRVDRTVPIGMVYQLSDSVTQITICPEYPALLRHQLPIPDW
jgi:hypothetical protein